jgi:hypothetical protein
MDSLEALSVVGMIVPPTPVLLAVSAVQMRVVNVRMIGFDNPRIVVRPFSVRIDVVVDFTGTNVPPPTSQLAPSLVSCQYST